MKFAALLAFLPLAVATSAPIIMPRADFPIPGKYIVKFRNVASSDYQAVLKAALGLLKTNATFVYKFGGFAGFAAEMSDDVVALVRKLPTVSASCI